MDGYEYWDGILEIYTWSSLTWPEDKLIALSGLVKEIGLIRNDNYLAGLWKNRFASQLIWPVFIPNIANNETYHVGLRHTGPRPGPGRRLMAKSSLATVTQINGARYLPY